MRTVIAAGLAFLVLSIGGALADDRQPPASAGEMQLSFAPVVKRVAPAVVNVYASRTVQQSMSPFFSDPFFRQFFGDQPGGPTRQRVQRSLGSGVIIDPSGLIVTNFHVIAQADEVKVALSDKREFTAEIILKDERSDLAILRIGSASSAPPRLPGTRLRLPHLLRSKAARSRVSGFRSWPAPSRAGLSAWATRR